MKLMGLLSWFDESVEMLTSCVTSQAKVGVTEILAVDGAYALYPDTKPCSPVNQRAALVMACEELGIGLTLHTPSDIWHGNEVEKRQALFDLAWSRANEDDWYWVIDADQTIRRCDCNLLERLSGVDEQAAVVSFHDIPAEIANRQDWPKYHPVRALFKAQPITVEHNHYTYVAQISGDVLWRGTIREGLVPAADLSVDVEVDHEPHKRSAMRKMNQDQYYIRRTQVGAEMRGCAAEGCSAKATARVTINMTIPKINGLLQPQGDITELCDKHARLQQKVNNIKIRQSGLDPTRVIFNERYDLPVHA